MYQYTITPEGAAFFMNGQYHNISTTHVNFAKIAQALKERRPESEILPLVDLAASVRKAFGNERDFDIRGGFVYYQGEPFPESISEKAIAMIEQGNDPTPLAKFLRKLRKHPIPTAADDLLRFCAANGLLIYEDGDIIAFKGINANWTDCHSGKIDNSIGAKIERLAMWQVDNNRDVPCSFGYHVGSMSFAESYGQRTVLVKIDPRDWVEVPKDHTWGKGRVCFYQIMAEMNREKPLPVQESYTARDIGVGIADEPELEDDDDCLDDERVHFPAGDLRACNDAEEIDAETADNINEVTCDECRDRARTE